MSKVKIGFNGLQVPMQVDRARHIVTRMTGNVSFLTPVPPLADISTAAGNLETAYNESRGRDKNKVQIMRLRRAELLALVTQLAAYVQSISNGNEEVILSSGFDVVHRGTPQPPVEKVANLRAFTGSVSGSIKLLWNRTIGARVYMVQIATDTASGEAFHERGITSKTRIKIDGLTPGIQYRVRAAAIGKNGFGNWSDTVIKIVE